MLSAQVSDTGRYVCVADNVAGSAEKSFNLNVHGESRVKCLIYILNDCQRLTTEVFFLHSKITVKILFAVLKISYLCPFSASHHYRPES